MFDGDKHVVPLTRLLLGRLYCRCLAYSMAEQAPTLRVSHHVLGRVTSKIVVFLSQTVTTGFHLPNGMNACLQAVLST
jgi:hypothetical protein